ncbi:ABC transporter ATP-binding protein [Caldalkalibacillus mannanilyticus]|uniref:ABC transporter ATP-binding protein n=1 Tax=Caldalkalibacillus mannanilyticus TaxID=1418 RepID=UPI000AF2D52D|nr:ABC transporter ATP-binding protein [Caldalkalibacillus mannanilyticus]
MEGILKAEHLSYGYTDSYLIKDLSLQFNRGEMVSVIGPNGSGKSTFLRLLTRLLKPEDGTVYLEGQDMKQWKNKEVAQKMTMLPQVHDHKLDLTVRDLVQHGRYSYLKWYQDYGKDQSSHIDWALSVTQLVSFQHRPLHTLSGGERQRAWIAMCIAQKPTILILDEPTSYLDISHQLEVLELLTELNQTLGITIIMVLHDVNQAARYSDRIIAMKQGKVVRQGIPKEVYDCQFFRDVFSIEAKVHLDGDTPICSPCGLVRSTT